MCSDLGWYFQQLEVRIFFYPRLHNLQLLVLELFYLFFYSLWRTDTIVFANLNKPLVFIKLLPQMCSK